MKKALVVLLLLAVGLGVSGAIEAAGGSRFSGQLPKFSAVTHNNFYIHPPGGWEPVPDTWVQFTTTRKGPAVATFCGEAAIAKDEFLFLRVVGAGKGVWKPGEVLLKFDSSLGGPFTARCFSWIATLPPGTHRVQAQWRFSGTAGLGYRSLRVEHQN